MSNKPKKEKRKRHTVCKVAPIKISAGSSCKVNVEDKYEFDDSILYGGEKIHDPLVEYNTGDKMLRIDLSYILKEDRLSYKQELLKNVDMLRQRLNEKPVDRLVTNEDILKWLDLTL